MNSFFQSPSIYIYIYVVIFESIPKVTRVCKCIWNIHIHASLTFGLLSKWLPYKIEFPDSFFCKKKKRAELWTCYIYSHIIRSIYVSHYFSITYTYITFIVSMYGFFILYMYVLEFVYIPFIMLSTWIATFFEIIAKATYF